MIPNPRNNSGAGPARIVKPGRSHSMNVPTEEELRAYRNVPLSVAAVYIGITRQTLSKVMQAGALTQIGEAVQTGENRWLYVIPAERLIRYCQGGGEVLLPSKMTERIAEDLSELIVSSILQEMKKAPAGSWDTGRDQTGDARGV